MWNLRSEDRLKEWKEFRATIGELPFDKAVEKTVHLWSYAPFVTHHLDHIDLLDWPDPWELLVENKYDELAKSLGMLYTLYFSPHRKDHTFAIAKARTHSSLENYNLVYIDDGKYILNYVFDDVISKEQLGNEVVGISFISQTDLQLSKY